jgi:hypothetical protein
VAYAENAALLEALQKDLGSLKDREALVVFFTNGAFDGIQHALVRALSGEK